MDRHTSPTESAPEVVPGTQRSTFGFVGSDDYEYYEPPPASASDRHRSPVPEYRRYEDNTISHTSPRVSAQSPPPPTGSDIGRSPQLSDSGFTKSRPLSPSVQYSEIHSPAPETVYQGGIYNQGEKEAVYNPHSKVPSYHQAYPVPGVIHQNSGDKPEFLSTTTQHREESRKKPFYKRWIFILGILALIVIIVLAVVLGVVLGTKKHTSSPSPTNTTSSSSSTATTSSAPKVTGDPSTAVGGYLSSSYYSNTGAWNGSGIAIAAAKPGVDQTLYAYFQDHTGSIVYTLLDSTGNWNLIGPINSNLYPALNGTPISAVNHQLGNQLVWHVFYIDTNYTIRERIMTNITTDSPTPLWTDGPLNKLNLKTWQSTSIGLQACYWGNYYGQWSYSATVANAGIHIWYASDATTFQQYDWTNGTAEWTHNQQWPNLSGNAGVGCQTWDSGMTEYVWFVDTKSNIAMYWKDGNRTGIPTTTHPVGTWTQVNNLGISNVQKDSSLGYTNYMLYQSQDASIHGANMTWAAENTTIAAGNVDGKDTWVLQSGGQNVPAILGSHMSITAISTASKGAVMYVFFQQTGNDMIVYSRDAYQTGGVWTAAGSNPQNPSKSS